VPRLPAVSVLLPLLLAGIFLPAWGPEPAKAPPGALGMRHEAFATDVVSLTCGDRLTMVNDSRWAHIIGPGREGLLKGDPGVPLDHRELVQTGGRYTTGPWRTPGVHYVTCAVHPEMTVKVIVRSCCC
jgi:plastocyanin